MKSRYDRVLKIIEDRAGRLRGKIDMEFKGKDPFDSARVKPMDMVAKYMTMLPEAREAVKMANPEGWQKLEGDVLKIMEGMKNAGMG